MKRLRNMMSGLACALINYWLFGITTDTLFLIFTIVFIGLELNDKIEDIQKKMNLCKRTKPAK